MMIHSYLRLVASVGLFGLIFSLLMNVSGYS